ncbi:TorF family putative porin [Roseateles sp. NT4]|uniref:TorF family putative porin n=1 Tax=Roseateles sp. NT4 TaxID=3453715 RepID=UPI003EEA571C
MPPAQLARLTTLVATLWACAGGAWADIGGTLSLQTDARERGMSYSANKPSAQLGLAWDGDAGWYGGAQLGHARFSQHQGAALQLYGGRVFGVAPGLDGEAGVVAHAYENVSSYDYQEVYAGLLGERWNLRAYFSPDYYGIGQRSLYTEFNLRWPLAPRLAALGHVGLLHGSGEPPSYVESRGSTRLDLRVGASWQLGASSELQLVWIAAGRGGPYTWTDATRRRTVVLGLTTAF